MEKIKKLVLKSLKFKVSVLILSINGTTSFNGLLDILVKAGHSGRET